MDESQPIVGNPGIEAAAVAYVIEQERLHACTAGDTRGHDAGDVESDGRTIEAKGFVFVARAARPTGLHARDNATAAHARAQRSVDEMRAPVRRLEGAARTR
jgi:hypothetical protein